MKVLTNVLTYIFVLAISAIIGWYAYQFLKKPMIPEGMVLVKQQFLDSLASFKPDTIIKYDTIPSKPDIIRVEKRVPYPVYLKDSLLSYNDTLKNASFLVSVHDTITTKGIIIHRHWNWQVFVPFQITKEITVIRPIPVPYPVKEVNILRYYGGIGIGTGFSVEGGVLLRDRFMLGGQVSKGFSGIKINILF